ncbi:MAG: hypothetical protein PUE69_03915 [Ruminococcus sp.]|nr:hypothetical protein [Ruminococcus sp.]MDY3845027.1 hypothetical protein [Ruminococcus sp.]
MYNRRKVEIIKERSPKGTRLCLDSMENDPQPISVRHKRNGNCSR